MPAVRAQAMRQLVAAPGAQPAPTSPLAFAPEVSVDARILIITANSTDPAFAAIQGTLAFLGTPYDVLDAASGPPLTDASLADGDHGKYQAVFLDLGDLSLGTASAFSDAEWMTLATYEARFGVRRVSLYTAPSAAYGLSATGAMIDATSAPVTASCTTAGAATFVGANCAAPVVIAAGWAYPARPTDAQTIPLLVDAAGNLYAATRTYPDGREALALTFAQSPDAMHTLELAYGLVSWATRGLFVGERHVYLSAQLDDFFLASTIYRGSAPTYRITGADLQALADWQTSRRANPLVAGLRLAWAANAEGSVTAGDALTAKAVALGPAFSWISHTWDHAELTLMGYADALLEFQRNDARIRALGLTPYATANLVTPGITGLDNPNAMQAAFDAGIRYLVSDTSIPSQDNPSPNAGFYNALVPGILEIPRIPTELDYDVSMPAEWMAEYNDIYGTSWGYDQLLAIQSRTLVGYMLAGNNDPWMFHQANTRDIGGGHSLLSDLLGATLDRYLAVATFPVLSPTMDELAARVIDRMTFNASGVSATIGPGDRLTVGVAKAAKVPVTGLCTANAETYAGQRISYLDLAAGASVALSLTGCNAGGSGGTSGTGGAQGAGGGGGGGSSGTGGRAGTGGTAGAGGTPGSGGMAGTGGAGGRAGASGNGGAIGSGGAGGGSVDAGAAVDVRMAADATTGDAGTTDASRKPASGSGCSCTVRDGAPSPGALLVSLLVLTVLPVRRRRQGRN